MELVYKKYIDISIFFGIERLFFVKQCPLKFISGIKWCPKKIGAKLLSDLVIFLIFSIFSSKFPLDFYDSIRVVPLKYLIYSLAGRNTK